MPFAVDEHPVAALGSRAPISRHIEAGHLVDLWGKAFVPAGYPQAQEATAATLRDIQYGDAALAARADRPPEADFLVGRDHEVAWADPASVTFWGRLARSAQQMPLLLVGMMRPVPQRDDLLALRRVVGDATRLRLAALTREAVIGLVAALAGGHPDGGLLELADGAAGTPLYVTELVAALARGSGLAVTEAGLRHAGHWGVRQVPCPRPSPTASVSSPGIAARL